MASNQLPVSFQLAALPPNVKWTPQQLAQAIVQRLSVVTGQQFALFVTGSTAPSSNVGPWLKNGQEWWVWSDTDGAYVPIIINGESLGYSIGPTAPDHTIFSFWIETTGGGQPLALKTWYSGAWTDVYASQFSNYSTTTQMNAAIAAAIAGIPGTAGINNFKVRKTAEQDIVFGGSGTQNGVVTFNSVDYDENSVFGTNRFTAPASGFYHFDAIMECGVVAGSPTDADLRAFFGKNGAEVDTLIDQPESTSLAARSLVGSTNLKLVAGDYVQLLYGFELNAAGTAGIFQTWTRLSGYRIR